MRNPSQLLALAASAVILVGITWAVAGDTPPDRGNLGTIDGRRFNTLVPSAQGELAPCAVCHRITAAGPERSAPSLWGIFGAQSARSTWFGYSPALSALGGSWTAERIDAYLADPVGFLPGTNKTLSRIGDPEQRQRIIAALQKLSP